MKLLQVNIKNDAQKHEQIATTNILYDNREHRTTFGKDILLVIFMIISNLGSVNYKEE